MYLLDLQDDLREHPDAPRADSEFELAARVDLTGVLDLGPVQLRSWEIPTKTQSQDVRAVYLRVSDRWESTEGPPDVPPKREQYFVPHGVAGEICALMTLFTRAHFSLQRRLKLGGIPLVERYPEFRTIATTPVDGSTIKLGTMEPLFNRLRGLQSKEKVSSLRRVEPFMLAARLYKQAVAWRELDDTLAYICLVSAIEAVCYDFKIETPPLAEVRRALAKTIGELDLDPEHKARLEQAALQDEKFLRRRFCEFIVHHLSADFWDDPTRPKAAWCRIKDPAHLGEILARVYKARSAALHEGQVFPPAHDMVGGIEVPFGKGMQIGKKAWKEKELVPPFSAFEKVVHCALVEHLRRESNPSN
jgi:hypothetical protein